MTDRKVTFGRIFWPSLWAALIVSILGLIIWLIVIGAFMSGLDSSKPFSVDNNSVLHMRLAGQINDKSSSNFDPSTFQMQQFSGVPDILYALEAAKKDDNIKGVFIEIDNMSCGFAAAREIRNAINDFEKSGKFTVAFNGGEVISQREYYIASASDESYGFPTSNFQFLGLGGELSFFKNTLDRLEVEMQVIRGSNNDFKSAVEPFFRDKMSDSSRVQMEKYMFSIWDDFLNDIAKDRKMTAEQLNQIAEEALVIDSESAVKQNLLDGTKYRDEVIELISKKANTPKDEELNLVKFSKYAKKRFYQNQVLVKEDNPNVAVILAEGGVSKSGDGLTSDEICKLFEEARNNETIKTVVFRINSPGGSALASEEIWREVKLTNDKKKVIVSMGNVAASGGYYIAAPASTIFAEPTTITGSIGVFGVIPFTGKMMENKLGLTFDRVATNKHAVLTTNKKLTEEQMTMIQANVDEIYELFKQRVAEGRGMTVEQVNVVGRGRVWSGRDAKEIGLVDELGGLNDAISFAAKQAGIKETKVLYYPHVKEDKLGELIEQFEENEDIEAKISTPALPKELIKYYEQLKQLESYQGIQMRMPYEIVIE